MAILHHAQKIDIKNNNNEVDGVAPYIYWGVGEIYEQLSEFPINLIVNELSSPK